MSGYGGVFVVAEVGVNHNGNRELALRLVDKAKECGADAVKFQTFKADQVACRFAPKAGYQREKGESEGQVEMLRRLELSFEDFFVIKRYCDAKGIEFLSTPFDGESAEFLYRIGVKRFKVASGEITNLPLLQKVASFSMPVILSTGMADLDEIRSAIDVFLSNGKRSRSELILLHCTTEYPCPYEDVNLRAMVTLKEEFGLPVGYSDHTPGIEVPIAAVVLGAVVIEKHFTLDRSLPGPDHRASLEPGEFLRMVQSIRNVEKALGTGEKRPTIREVEMRKFARRSIVAKRRIRKGEIFSEENLTTKRPGWGISPMRWNEVLGRRAKRDFEPDEMIEL